MSGRIGGKQWLNAIAYSVSRFVGNTVIYRPNEERGVHRYRYVHKCLLHRSECLSASDVNKDLIPKAKHLVPEATDPQHA